MLKHVIGELWKKGVLTQGGDKIRYSMYVPASGFHCEKPEITPRSFFGVEDYRDDDNSRPYTDVKQRRKTNINRIVSFKRRTGQYTHPFLLMLSMKKRFLLASFLHRVTCKRVVLVGTNSKCIRDELKSKVDIPACLTLGRALAEKAKEADIYTACYVSCERFEGKNRAIVQSLIDNGIDIKVYLNY